MFHSMPDTDHETVAKMLRELTVEHSIEIDNDGETVQAFCINCPKSSSPKHVEDYYTDSRGVLAEDYARDDAESELRDNVGCTPDGQQR